MKINLIFASLLISFQCNAFNTTIVDQNDYSETNPDYATFYKKGGMVITSDFIAFEAEATVSPFGAWKLLKKGDADFDGIKGEVPPINNSYLEYQSGSLNGSGINSGTDILEYTFIPKTSGEYRLTGRMGQRLTVNGNVARNDQCNDIFIKCEGDFSDEKDSLKLHIITNWVKFYGRGLDSWGSFIDGDYKNKKYHMVYKFKAGKSYKFSISGRSKNCCIDYFIFSKQPLVIESKKDLAVVNDKKYRPGFTGLYKKCSIVYNSLEFDKFKGLNSKYCDASIDRRRNVLQVDKRLKTAAAEFKFNGPDGQYYMIINTLLEKDGESTFTVFVNNRKVGNITNQRILGTDVKDYTEKQYKISDKKIKMKSGDVIKVEFNNTSNNKVKEGNQFATSRGRWKSLTLLSE